MQSAHTPRPTRSSTTGEPPPMSSPAGRSNAFRISKLDFKVGLRMLARYPGLSIVGTLAIAVGIALGSLYFELLDKWQNPRLPVADASRMVALHNWGVSAATEERRVLSDYSLWRRKLRTIE